MGRTYTPPFYSILAGKAWSLTIKADSLAGPPYPPWPTPGKASRSPPGEAGGTGYDEIPSPHVLKYPKKNCVNIGLIHFGIWMACNMRGDGIVYIYIYIYSYCEIL